MFGPPAFDCDGGQQVASKSTSYYVTIRAQSFDNSHSGLNPLNVNPENGQTYSNKELHGWIVITLLLSFISSLPSSPFSK